MKTPYQRDVALWSYKWVFGWVDWISPGGGMYRAPYGAISIKDDNDDVRARAQPPAEYCIEVEVGNS